MNNNIYTEAEVLEILKKFNQSTSIQLFESYIENWWEKNKNNFNKENDLHITVRWNETGYNEYDYLIVPENTPSDLITKTISEGYGSSAEWWNSTPIERENVTYRSFNLIN